MGRTHDMTTSLELQGRWYADNIPLRDQVVVDVGANVGVISERFWSEGAGTNRVHSVEPLVENVERLRRRIPAGASWTVHECAISTTSGSVGLRVEHEGDGGLNSAIDTVAIDRRVPGRRLHELVPDATVVKLDVEGHEYEILRDALPFMESVHTWAIEFHMMPGHPLERALGALAAAGHRLFAAGRRANDPTGPWVSKPIPPLLSWAPIPPAGTRPDGQPIKMLHVLAQRDRDAQ